MPRRPPRYQPSGTLSRQAADKARGTARQRGYTPDWDRSSAVFKSLHPLCLYCQVGIFGEARDVATDLVDHLYPHRVYRGVFWIVRLWVPSCTTCHSGPKQIVERQGKAALDHLASRLGLQPLPDRSGGGGV